MLMQIIISQNAFIMLDNKTKRRQKKKLHQQQQQQQHGISLSSGYGRAVCSRHSYYIAHVKWKFKRCFEMERKAIINTESSLGAKRANSITLEHTKGTINRSMMCMPYIYVALVSSTRQQLSLHVFFLCLLLLWINSLIYSVGVLIRNVNCVLKYSFLLSCSIHFMCANFPSIFVVQIRIRSWIFKQSF